MIVTLTDGRFFCSCQCPHCMLHPERVLGLSFDDAMKLPARKSSLVIDLSDPENMGGKWLQ